MSSSPAEVERKLRRHDNDIAGIYEIVADVQRVQRRHTRRLGKIGGAVERLEARINKHDVRFDAVDARFDRVDEQLAEVLDLLRGRDS
jgi:septation ring formation regulator EzrA